MAATASKITDTENAIRTSWILKVLDETIEKIELALCLPVFLKNLDRFANHFNEDELIILSKCKIYQSEDTKDNKSLPDSIDEDEIKASLLSDSSNEMQTSTGSWKKESEHYELQYDKYPSKVFEDPNIKKAINIIWKHANLVNVVKTEYFKFTRDSPEFIFMENIHALRQCANVRMTNDHSFEAGKKNILYYKNIWYKNDEALKEINSLKPQLINILSQVQNDLERKNNLINEMYNRMKNFDVQYQEEIENLCTESEKNMIIESKSSEIRQADINNNIKKLDETFENTINGHLKREKELRVKRFKIESQLEVSLETYDNDLREKQAEYDDILAGYKDEQQQMAALQKKFDEQEKEYTVLMKEKAYEEHLELERCIEDLRRRVAARIIQTYWRALKQRRLERMRSKKAKKGKKKKGGKKGKNPKKPKIPQTKGGSGTKKPGSAGKRQ